ncbi:unnamed protein product [Amoebophrya sp. A120]|nr:unnamed protein product [Amoebophrya sp. A120]|eukprot:GSA120T00000605001.1
MPGPRLGEAGEEFIRLLSDLNAQVMAFDFSHPETEAPEKEAWLPALLDKFMECCHSDIDPATGRFAEKYDDAIRETWRKYVDGISGDQIDLTKAAMEYYRAICENINDGGEELAEDEAVKSADGCVDVLKAACLENREDRDAAKAALKPKLEASGFVFKPEERM